MLLAWAGSGVDEGFTLGVLRGGRGGVEGIGEGRAVGLVMRRCGAVVQIE
jgi:hypothetical protein